MVTAVQQLTKTVEELQLTGERHHDQCHKSGVSLQEQIEALNERLTDLELSVKPRGPDGNFLDLAASDAAPSLADPTVSEEPSTRMPAGGWGFDAVGGEPPAGVANLGGSLPHSPNPHGVDHVGCRRESTGGFPGGPSGPGHLASATALSTTQVVDRLVPHDLRAQFGTPAL